MGILSRFRDIMSANVNSLLDKAEDPEKMIDQYLRDLNRDLGNVKSETAAVMADEARAARDLDETNAEIGKMQSYAEKAVAAGNDDDARAFLQKKSELAKKAEDQKKILDAAKANSEHMKAMHDKLTKDINTLEEKRSVIKSKVRMAKAQQDINKVTSSAADAGDSINAFKRMEEKADRMLDEANAMAELDSSSGSDKLEDLKSKYDDAPGNSADADIEAELAALKAKSGN